MCGHISQRGYELNPIFTNYSLVVCCKLFNLGSYLCKGDSKEDMRKLYYPFIFLTKHQARSYPVVPCSGDKITISSQNSKLSREDRN